MIEEQPRRGSSCVLQGCLFSAVALFAVLLIVMLFLAYARFREHTADPDPAAAAVTPTDGSDRFVFLSERRPAIDPGLFESQAPVLARLG